MMPHFIHRRPLVCMVDYMVSLRIGCLGQALGTSCEPWRSGDMTIGHPAAFSVVPSYLQNGDVFICQLIDPGIPGHLTQARREGVLLTGGGPEGGRASSSGKWSHIQGPPF